MDAAALADLLQSLALGIALAACAGYLELGPSFQFLTTNRALLLFAAATLIEIAGDKIPAVDHALDALATFLRPAAGSVLAASVLGQVSDPLPALALGVAVGAPAALVPHAAKSALRAVSTAVTAGIANPILSLVEDVLTLVLFALAILIPVAMALGMALVAALVVRRLTRRPRPAVGTA